MILCGVLCAMSFAISDFGSVKAYATEPQNLGNSVQVELTKLPKSGESTDISNFRLEVPSDSHYTAQFCNGTKYPQENYWVETSTSSSDKPAGQTFLGGHNYRIAVLITAESGYYFDYDSNDSNKTKVNQGGNCQNRHRQPVRHQKGVSFKPN